MRFKRSNSRVGRYLRPAVVRPHGRHQRSLGERMQWALTRALAWGAVTAFGLVWADWHQRVVFG